MRFNFIDKNIEVINGVNVTVWFEKDYEDQSGTFNGLGIGVPVASGTAYRNGLSVGIFGVGAGKRLTGLTFGGLAVGAGDEVIGLNLAGIAVGAGKN